MLEKRSLSRQVILSTLAQISGRSVNVALPFLVVFFCGAGNQVDSFFVALSIAFYFYGSVSGAMNDSLASARLSTRRSLAPLHAIVFASMSGLFSAAILIVILDQSDSFSWVMGFMAGALSFLGVMTCLWVPVLTVRHDFYTSGFSWLWRLVVLLVATPLVGTSTPVLLLFAYCLVLADLLRLMTLALVASRPFPVTVKYLALGSVIAFWPYILGTLLQGLNPVVDRLMASLLVEGSVVVLEMADRLFWAVAAILTIGLQPVLLISLGEKYIAAELDPAYWRRLLSMVFFGASGCALLLVVLGWLLVIYMGEWVLPELTGEQRWAIWGCVIIYALILPAYVVATVCSRIFIIAERHSLLLFLGFISLVVNVVFSYPLLLMLGVKGIVLGTGVSVYVGLVLSMKFSNYIIHNRHIKNV